ncbi:MAG: PD-(D/E)XK nuclease family protein [Mycobacteriales bacterium]
MIAPASVEDVLWSVWSASGLPARLEGIVRRGGPAADIADRDLDAAVALFDAAARFVDQLPPGTDVRSFIESLAGQQIPGDTLAPASRTGDRVRVLTAHAAKGLQWPLVVVVGVQEGSWPDLRRRGSVLGSEVLVDVAGGHDPQVVSALGPLLTEERRLFYVAITRASRALLVTAVQGDDETPSRFLAEIDPRSAGDDRQPQVIRRFFALPAIVAEMRSAVTDPAAPMPRREAAARGLARLAAAGVRGADPAGWWGLAPISDDAPLLPGSDPVRVSASQVQKFADCQLRWFLEGAGAASAASVSQSLGVILHALAEAAVTEGLDDDALRARLDDALDDIERDLGPPWRLDRERRDAHTKLDKLLGWLHARTDDVEVVGVELPFDLQVDRAHLTGRVDRLERHDGATLVVVDFKTGSGSGKPTGEKLARFPQLGIYQLAVTGGGFAEVDDSRSSGGASLVYLGGTAKASEPRQRALAEDPDPDWARALAADTADGMGGSVFLATPSTQCRLCAARYCCPSVLVGRQVGGDDR